MFNTFLLQLDFDFFTIRHETAFILKVTSGCGVFKFCWLDNTTSLGPNSEPAWIQYVISDRNQERNRQVRFVWLQFRWAARGGSTWFPGGSVGRFGSWRFDGSKGFQLKPNFCCLWFISVWLFAQRPGKICGLFLRTARDLTGRARAEVNIYLLSGALILRQQAAVSCSRAGFRCPAAWCWKWAWTSYVTNSNFSAQWSQATTVPMATTKPRLIVSL